MTAILLSAWPLCGSHSVEYDGVQGVWLSDDELGAVEIAPCGSFMCGHVVWLRNPKGPNQQPLVDGNNSDPALRLRAICGLRVLGDLKLQNEGIWDGGWVYDPKQGKMFDVALSLKDENTLVVLGYLKTKFLSETHYWTRAAPRLARCR